MAPARYPARAEAPRPKPTAIGVLAAIVLGAAIYVSKARKSELDAEVEFADKASVNA